MSKKRIMIAVMAIISAIVVAIVTIIAVRRNDPDRQLALNTDEIKHQIAQINVELIRHPSPDEVQYREFSPLPPPDYAATSMPQDEIRKAMNDDKERLISRYIKEELNPKVQSFTDKWNPIFAGFQGLDRLGKTAKLTEMDRDLASLEKIDGRFQSVVLKARLQKIRDLVGKTQIALAGI